MNYRIENVGMTVFVCLGLLMGCITGRQLFGIDKYVTSPLTLEAGWTEVGQQEVKDVTCEQRLLFDLGEGVVKAVRIEVLGQVNGGSAILQGLCSTEKFPFPSTVLKGHVEAVIKQIHNTRILLLKYVPDAVSSGNLMIRVWQRATDIPQSVGSDSGD